MGLMLQGKLMGFLPILEAKFCSRHHNLCRTSVSFLGGARMNTA